MQTEGIDLTRPHKTYHKGCEVSTSKCLQVYPQANGTLLYCHACKKKYWSKFEGTFAEYTERKKHNLEVQEKLQRLRQFKDWSLPADFSHTLPVIALAWLTKAGLGPELINTNNIGYSEELKRLIIPLDVGWLGRSFEKKQKDLSIARYVLHSTSKYVYYTNSRIFCNDSGLNSVCTGSSIAVVEDVLSAIRVSRFIDVLCLLGTPKHMPIKLTGKEVLLWLDPDKAGQASTKSLIADLMWYNKARVITSTKDPKYYSDEEIQQLLTERG